MGILFQLQCHAAVGDNSSNDSNLRTKIKGVAIGLIAVFLLN